jgi:cation diffusion facilitator CzcD-associated flavoprotein CzcO
MASTVAAAGDTNPIEHVDVLIVGAGISGIGSAWHLQEQCPDKSYLILEAKETFGGTWETHKYPGVRSDSDLYTFGYRFKPWVGAPVASGAEILKYLGEVIDENGIGPHIRSVTVSPRAAGRARPIAGRSRRCGTRTARSSR